MIESIKTETSFVYFMYLYFNKDSGIDQFGMPSNFEYLRKTFHFLESLLPEDIQLKFLDLGSGIGNAIYTACDILGRKQEYFGVEHNKNYVEVTRGISDLLHPDFSKWTLFHQDILSKETEDLIIDMDIVYTYYPIPNTEKMYQMYSMINNKMKLGSYFICNDISLPPNLNNFEVIKSIKQDCNCPKKTQVAEIVIYRKIK